MSHNIQHYSYPENCDRAKVKAEIDHFVAMEDYQEGCTGLYHPIRWIETDICMDYESAIKTIVKLDRGDYDNLAIRFYNYLPYYDSKTEELEEKKSAAYSKYRKLDNIVYPKTLRSAYITCKVCGSKLSRTRLAGNNCPLCKNSLLPESYRVKIQAAKEKFEKACDNLRKYRRSKAEKTVMWLVKFEYHT